MLFELCQVFGHAYCCDLGTVPRRLDPILGAGVPVCSDSYAAGVLHLRMVVPNKASPRPFLAASAYRPSNTSICEGFLIGSLSPSSPTHASVDLVQAIQHGRVVRLQHRSASVKYNSSILLEQKVITLRATRQAAGKHKSTFAGKSGIPKRTADRPH